MDTTNTTLTPGTIVRVLCAGGKLGKVTNVDFPYAGDVMVLVEGEKAETVCDRSMVEG